MSGQMGALLAVGNPHWHKEGPQKGAVLRICSLLVTHAPHSLPTLVSVQIPWALVVLSNSSNTSAVPCFGGLGWGFTLSY